MKLRLSVSFQMVYFVFTVISLRHYCLYASLFHSRDSKHFHIDLDIETCCTDANPIYVFKKMVRTPSVSHTRSGVTEFVLNVTERQRDRDQFSGIDRAIEGWGWIDRAKYRGIGMDR